MFKFPLLLANEAVDEVAASSGGSGLDINGPLIIREFELFGIEMKLTESITVQWVVIILLGVLFFALGRGLKVKPESKRQVIAEWVVSMFSGMVNDSMGAKYRKYVPYIGALFCFSAVSSLSTLLGFRPPTSDISVVGTWGVLTFILVQRNRFKTGGLFGGVKSLTEPVIVMTPMNLVGEVAGPFAQTCRHYANIIAGVIIGSIIYWALGLIAVPVFIPSLFSLYFDIFASIVQAFIFCTLTMVYISMADCSPRTAE